MATKFKHHIYLPADLVEMVCEEVPAGSLSVRVEAVLRWYFQEKRPTGLARKTKSSKPEPVKLTSNLDDPIPGF